MEKNSIKERTVVIVKPDGVRRGLVGEIIRRFEIRGLKLIALKMVRATLEHIDGHYPQEKEWIENLGRKSLKTYEEYGFDPVKELGTANPLEIGKRVRKWLIDFMTSTPLVTVVMEGPHAISQVRKIVGSTIPSFAELGTVRGDFSIDSPALANLEKRPVFNLIHASEDKEAAKKELEHWFSPEEICDWDD